MQNRNDINHTNNRYHVTSRLSPFGYCVIGIVGFLVLLLFGHILLPLAVIAGIGWLIWKFRWAIRYYYGQIDRRIDDVAQTYRQRCQKDRHSRQSRSAQSSHPFQTSRQSPPNQAKYAGWNSNAAEQNDRYNVIFDVTPEKEDHP